MKLEEFAAKYEAQIRGLVLEGFATRSEKPSELGRRFDFWTREIVRLVAEMYREAQPEEKPAGFGQSKSAGNGTVPRPANVPMGARN